MSRAPSIRTGLTGEEIKRDFRENLFFRLGRADRFAIRHDQFYALAIRDYCDGVWNTKPAGTPS